MKLGIYVHRKTGKAVRVICVTNENAESCREDEYPDTVVYLEQGDEPSYWSKPLSKFNESYSKKIDYEARHWRAVDE